MRTGYLFNLNGVRREEVVAWAIERLPIMARRTSRAPSVPACERGRSMARALAPGALSAKADSEADEANKPAEVGGDRGVPPSQAEFRHNVITFIANPLDGGGFLRR